MLPAGQLPWDNPGAAHSLHRPGKGKGETERAGDMEQRESQDWDWLIWEERSQLGPSAQLSSMVRILAPPGLQLEGRAQLDGPRCPSRDPSSEIKALA